MSGVLFDKILGRIREGGDGGSIDISGKADKVSIAKNGDFAGLDANGNLTDSGYSPSDFVQVLEVEDVMELTEAQLNALRSGDIIVQIPGGQETLKTTWVVETYTNYPQLRRELSISNIHTYSLQTENVAHVNIHTIIYKSEFNQTSQQYEWDILNPIATNCNISDKADKILRETAQPAGGMLPNTLYTLGELATDTTFVMAAATDNTIGNVWTWTFSTGATAPMITWPAQITMWADGEAPTIEANKHYEVSVMDGLACVVSADIPQQQSND